MRFALKIVLTFALLLPPVAPQFYFPPVIPIRMQNAGVALAPRPYLNCIGQTTCAVQSNSAISISVAAGAGGELNLSAYTVVRAGGTGVHTQFTTTNSATLTGATYVVDVTGSGGGNNVTKLCSDGASCGAGNVYATCTTSCTAVAGTITTCVVNKSAVPASTTMSWSETTACATQDPGANMNAHFTEP